jgi:hypothetical protein
MNIQDVKGRVFSLLIFQPGMCFVVGMTKTKKFESQTTCVRAKI